MSAFETETRPLAPSIRIDRDVEMKTRDGVVLRADVVRPDVPEPVPVLVNRTPYDKNLRINSYAHLRPLDAAKAGFAVVFQDIRGRFASEGEWTVMGWDDVEQRDGCDCVEWVAGQPWCNGRVGLFGGSYEGLNALAAAQARPPSLRAIAPSLLGGADARKTTMMLEGVILSWSALVAVDVLEKQRTRGELDRTHLANAMGALVDPGRASRTLPLEKLPPLTVPGMPSYQELVDRLLRASGAVIGGVDRIEVPSLWTTGWWDHAGGSDLFRAARQRGGTPLAREESRFLVGPWSHTQHDVSLGELGFGQLASLPSAGVGAAHVVFFSRHLKDGETPALPVVRYFLTGKNAWQEATEWPPPKTEMRRLHLHAEHGANSMRGDGRLSEASPSGDDGADRYVYDPANPVPSVGWRALNLGGSTVAGPFDQARVERRDDVLVYTSEPLDDVLEVTGAPEVYLFVSSSAPDTDFMVKLCDVDPEGISRNVADGFVRLRWREGGDEPRFVTPGEVVELRIDLGFVGHAFLPGHKLRLQLTSSAFPHVDRNMNTGGPVGAETEGARAEQKVYRNAKFPSHLRLPVRKKT